MSIQGLSNVINGFAKLGFHPGRQWLRDFCTEVANQIHDMGPQVGRQIRNLGYPNTLERIRKLEGVGKSEGSLSGGALGSSASHVSTALPGHFPRKV